jgi:L-amino acid N-acyltransferase YncA
MMKSVEPATAEDLTILCQLLGYKPHSDMKGIKLVIDGEIGAMTGYDGWTENSVVMHIWIKPGSMVDREFVREAFRYPFEIGNRGLVLGVIPGYNAASLTLARAIGFRETYRVKDGYAAGTDLVIQEMRREECRWLTRGSASGQEHSGRT